MPRPCPSGSRLVKTFLDLKNQSFFHYEKIMRFKKSLQKPGARRTRAWHHHGSDTPTSPTRLQHLIFPDENNFILGYSHGHVCQYCCEHETGIAVETINRKVRGIWNKLRQSIYNRNGGRTENLRGRVVKWGAYSAPHPWLRQGQLTCQNMLSVPPSLYK